MKELKLFNRDFSATISAGSKNNEQCELLVEKLIKSLNYSAIIIITDDKNKYDFCNHYSDKYRENELGIYDTKFAKKEYYFSAKQILNSVGKNARKLIIFDSELYTIGTDGFIIDSIKFGAGKNQDTLIITQSNSKKSIISSDFNVIFDADKKYECIISTSHKIYKYNFINDMIEKCISN